MSVADRWAREPRDAGEPSPLPVERTLADEPVVVPACEREHDEPGVVIERDVREHPLVPAGEPRRPLDLDKVHEVAVALSSLFAVVVATIGGAFALGAVFGAWVGFLLPLAVGLLGTGYSMAKAAARRAERERRAHFAAQQERTNHDATAGFDIPVVR